MGISADRPERNLAWTKELNLPFRLLSDPTGAIGRLYGVWDDTWNLERRFTFVVDRARRVRYVESGGPAVETNGVLEALTTIARAK